MMILKLNATGLQHWPLQANTQATYFDYSTLRVCNHMKNFQMQYKDSENPEDFLFTSVSGLILFLMLYQTLGQKFRRCNGDFEIR